MVIRMWRWIWTVLAAAAVSFLIVGTDPANTATAGDPAAQRALDAITSQVFDPENPSRAFPADYFAVMGYLPVTAVGPFGEPLLIKPNGDCSGPIGTTKYDFDIVCKQHDLSYDVLRYAADIGAPLPAAGRKAADAMFGRQLHARCDSLALTGPDNALCQTIAESYGVICKINGWRQGYGAPATESAMRWVAAEMMVFVLLLARVFSLLITQWQRVRGTHDFEFIHCWHHPAKPAVAARRVPAAGQVPAAVGR